MIKLINDKTDHFALVSISDLYYKLSPENLNDLSLPKQNAVLLILSWLPSIKQINFKNYEYGDSSEEYCMITFCNSFDPLTLYNSHIEWILENITEEFYD